MNDPRNYANSIDLRNIGLLGGPPSPSSFKPGDYRNSYQFERLLRGYEPEHASIFKAPDNHNTKNNLRKEMASYLKKNPRKSQRNIKDIRKIIEKNVSIKIQKPKQQNPPVQPKRNRQRQRQQYPDYQFANYIDNSRIVQRTPLRLHTNLLLQYLTKIPNNGGGDCFFYSVAQANIPRNIIDQIADPRIRALFGNGPITMQQLRNVVAELVSVSDFMDYNTQQVQLYVAEQNPSYKQNKRATLYMKELYTAQELQQMNPNIENIKRLLQNVVQDNEEINRLIQSMMSIEEARQKINSFKRYVRTSNYWADMMTVNLLRDSLNIQFIIFDSNERQITNIIKFDDQRMFAGYIIIWWTSPVHYELLQYNGTGFFTFETLPPLIKYLVNANVENCPQCNDDAHFPIVQAPAPAQDQAIGGASKKKLTKKKLTR
jgi:hypothetical protein